MTFRVGGAEVMDWKKRSEQGEVCGILGCQNPPNHHCPPCHNWYCDEHIKGHFHRIKKELALQ